MISIIVFYEIFDHSYRFILTFRLHVTDIFSIWNDIFFDLFCHYELHFEYVVFVLLPSFQYITTHISDIVVFWNLLDDSIQKWKKLKNIFDVKRMIFSFTQIKRYIINWSIIRDQRSDNCLIKQIVMTKNRSQTFHHSWYSTIEY